MPGVANVYDQDPVFHKPIVDLVTLVGVPTATLVVRSAHARVIGLKVKAVVEAADILSGLLFAEMLVGVTDDVLDLAQRLAS